MRYPKLLVLIAVLFLALSSCLPVGSDASDERSANNGNNSEVDLNDQGSDNDPQDSLSEVDQLRNEILLRAKIWVDQAVPYSTKISKEWGYRTDCSGYVSYAWDLPKDKNGGYTTDTLDQVAFDISVEDLQPGDILNLPRSGSYGHAIIFIDWVDKEKMVLSAYEENGSAYYDKAVFRSSLTLEYRNGGYYIPEEGDTGPYSAMRWNEFEDRAADSEIIPPLQDSSTTSLDGVWVFALRVDYGKDSYGNLSGGSNGSWTLDLRQDKSAITGSTLESDLCPANVEGKVDALGQVTLTLTFDQCCQGLVTEINGSYDGQRTIIGTHNPVGPIPGSCIGLWADLIAIRQ